MDALRLVVIVAAALWSAEARAASSAARVSTWQPFIDEASQRFAIPSEWIGRVMQAESAGVTELGGRPVRSRAGAIGLMQLMPATWNAMRTGYHLGVDPDDPHDNIVAGAGFLRRMYDRFGFPGMFAAYNAGPARYTAYLARRSPLPRETIVYLASVTGRGEATAITSHASPRDMLFALRNDLASDARRPADPPPHDDLFAIRTTVP